MLESERAKIAALRRYKAHVSDPTTADLKPWAFEVRMESAGPDISLHLCEGSRTQGGYLFSAGFLEELRKQDEE